MITRILQSTFLAAACLLPLAGCDVDVDRPESDVPADVMPETSEGTDVTIDDDEDRLLPDVDVDTEGTDVEVGNE